jgi:acetylornithine deacetylase/succinyl-diaminopimelate desuccinylase-like protein
MGRKAVRRQRSDVTIDEDEVLELSRELIRIPSVYTKELDVARHVAARLRELGFSPRTIPVDGHGPDVVTEFGRKDAPAIVFNGHMDTVDVMQGWKHDPFDAKVERGCSTASARWT